MERKRTLRLIPTRGPRGFTLLELIVVMTIVALLASIAAPRYFDSIDRARERVLLQNLNLLRDAIDKFHAELVKVLAQPDVRKTLAEGLGMDLGVSSPEALQKWTLEQLSRWVKIVKDNGI